jgi:hypothetical protein
VNDYKKAKRLDGALLFLLTGKRVLRSPVLKATIHAVNVRETFAGKKIGSALAAIAVIAINNQWRMSVIAVDKCFYVTVIQMYGIFYVSA